jgi:hypothetical protein
MGQNPSRVNPPLDLTRDAFALTGGLDLVSPKINVPKGSLLDCSNREIIDRIGYKRIDGFEPFDGRVNPAQTEYYYIDSTTYVPVGANFAADFPDNTLLVVDNAPSELFGIVVARATLADTPTVGTTTYRIFFARINEEAEPTGGSSPETVQPYLQTSIDFPITEDGVSICSEDLGEDAREIVDRFNGYATTLRSRISSLHDTPIGLHWFRDRPFAVVDDVVVYFTQTAGTATVYTNSLISKTGGTARVLDVQLQDNTAWADGDAAGTMTIEVLSGTWGTTGSCTVTDPALATTFDLRAQNTSLDPAPRFASLWRTRSEQQAIDESGTAGWDRIDHGYEIDFEDGFSDTGGFTVVSRGSENNFTFVTSSVLQFPSEILNGNNVSGTTFAPSSKTFIATAESVENGDPGWQRTVSRS